MIEEPDMKEVPSFPKGWEMLTFTEISSGIIDGTHFTPAYVPDGVQFFSVENVTADDFDDTKYISLEEHRRLSSRCPVERGDILLTRIGSLGDTKLIDWDVEASIYVSLALLKLKQGIDPRYVYAYTQSKQFVSDVEARSLLNATPKKINLGDIGHVPIIIPPLDEQEAIAAVLSDANELTQSLSRLIAKKRAIKQATMQQLLTGGTRLPGFSGEWDVARLGDVAHIKTGSRNNEDKVGDGLYPFFVRSQTVERINTYSFEGEAILVPGEGGIGSIFHYITGRFDVHQRVYRISTFADKVSGQYVYYYMLQHFGPHAMRNSVKATVDSLRLPTFKSFGLLVPDIDEQGAIAEVLSDIDAEIGVLSARLAKTRDIKRGMMQELLTGRIRLVSPKEVAA